MWGTHPLITVTYLNLGVTVIRREGSKGNLSRRPLCGLEPRAKQGVCFCYLRTTQRQCVHQWLRGRVKRSRTNCFKSFIGLRSRLLTRNFTTNIAIPTNRKSSCARTVSRYYFFFLRLQFFSYGNPLFSQIKISDQHPTQFQPFLVIVFVLPCWN